MNLKFWFYCTFKSISIIFLVWYLQLSDFRPVMKLYDLLYPEKQVGKIQDVHLCYITKIILFNFRSLENDSCQGSANFKIISWQPEIMVTWCKISGSSPKNQLLLQLISSSLVNENITVPHMTSEHGLPNLRLWCKVSHQIFSLLTMATKTGELILSACHILWCYIKYLS